MAGRNDANKYSRAAAARRCSVVVGGALGAFVAAAAMATGSATPAKADFEDLLDPIIQPLLTSLTDSLTAIDPSAAVDITSWSDSLLNSLSSIDLALPAAAEPASAVGASAEPAAAATTGSYDLPITIQEDTEPTVTATVDGSSTDLLVDSGSSGLVIPETDLGSNSLTQLESLFALGAPTGIGESGYSGGVDYIYLTYNDVSVDYDTSTGTDLVTSTPVEVEVYSWDPSDFSSFFTNDAFQSFLGDNDSTGILGIGDSASGSAGESPLQAAGFGGVTVDEASSNPDPVLIVSSTPDTTGVDLTASGATVSGLTETVTDGSTVVGTGTVADDFDSGGVYGTIPESITGSSDTVPAGDTVTVSDNGTPLYTYTVGTDSDGTDTAPTAVDSSDIDSGVIPFEQNLISFDYDNGDIYLDPVS